MKKIILNFIIALLIGIFFSILYYKNPSFLQKFNTAFIDLSFNLRGEQKASKDIVIVDIDEKSLQKLGQWPWSRDKIAKIITNLTNKKAAIIGLDMVFAEKDRTSLKNILKKLHINIKNKNIILDNDELLANVIKKSPVILGMVFNFENNITTNHLPIQKAIFIQRNKTEFNDLIPKAKGYTSNIDILNNSAYSSGSFNMFFDSDGVVRYVPLMFSYKDSLYPSLSLEIVRILLGEKIVNIVYDENGVFFIKIGNLIIPTDKFGRLFVNYRGKNKYKYISAYDIYNNNFSQKSVEGKVILIGTSAAGLLDLRSTPFNPSVPGIEIHANVLDNMINQDFIQDSSFLFGKTVLIIIILPLIIAFILSFISSAFYSLLISILYIGGVYYYFYYEMFYQKNLLNFLYPILSTTLTIFYIFFTKFFIEAKQKRLIKEKFSKKVSSAIVDELLKSKNNFIAKEKEVTIFFSDIRNFTTLSEEFKDAKNLLNYLNIYLSKMSAIVIKFNGTIDKYIGDAIMAYWNAPLNQKNHADLAVKCAILQIKSLKELNKILNPPIAIGIGIHTGIATVGEIGNEKRSDFTIIGDSVNLCSRLEGLTKAYGVKIIISENTKKKLKGKYKIKELDRVLVKGKNKSILIYEVWDEGEFTQEEKEELKIYYQALNFYKNADFIKAMEIFDLLYQKYTKYLYLMYKKRCEDMLKQNIKNFDGVYRFVTK